jgi:hypothetical protein
MNKMDTATPLLALVAVSGLYIMSRRSETATNEQLNAPVQPMKSPQYIPTHVSDPGMDSVNEFAGRNRLPLMYRTA